MHIYIYIYIYIWVFIYLYLYMCVAHFFPSRSFKTEGVNWCMESSRRYQYLIEACRNILSGAPVSMFDWKVQFPDQIFTVIELVAHGNRSAGASGKRRDTHRLLDAVRNFFFSFCWFDFSWAIAMNFPATWFKVVEEEGEESEHCFKVTGYGGAVIAKIKQNNKKYINKKERKKEANRKREREIERNREK